jgi:Methyltransferase domain
MTNNRVTRRYLDGSYFSQNPDWDRNDSPWKAAIVISVLREAGLSPKCICEVGCGAGGVLATLRQAFSDAALVGFDIAPDAAAFWNALARDDIEFRCEDFTTADSGHYDLLLLLDVLEHLSDPFTFLEAIRHRASHFIFHFPLDLSALSIVQEKKLLVLRETVGHIHYYTKNIALALLRESGFNPVRWRYTNASLTGPNAGVANRFARLPRRIAYALNKDVGVRLLGGETLMVLAAAA